MHKLPSQQTDNTFEYPNAIVLFQCKGGKCMEMEEGRTGE
jgi:hypothetical protein